MSYIADENGYRVTEMETNPIGDGPNKNKLGKAIVQTTQNGVRTQYAIKAEPVEYDEDGENAESRTNIELVDVTDPVFANDDEEYDVVYEE